MIVKSPSSPVRWSGSAILKLGLFSLLLVLVLAPWANACQQCYQVPLPWWPYLGVDCFPAVGPGRELCFDDNHGFFCQTQGAACEGGGPGCFLAGTRISTPDGDRPIESLQEGDAIWCVGEDGQRIVGKILQTTRATSHGYYRLNGTTLVTGAHRFLTVKSEESSEPALASTLYEQHPLGQWIPLQDLAVGQQLRTTDGDSKAIETVEFVNRGVRVYNFEVAPHHNYFANGYLVHNRKPVPTD